MKGWMFTNEEEKMNQREWYDANYDPLLVKKREKAMDFCYEYNQLKPSDHEHRNQILGELLGYEPQGLTLLSPFMCDYGNRIQFGEDVFVSILLFYGWWGNLYRQSCFYRLRLLYGYASS